jgi:hypothetical protein
LERIGNKFWDMASSFRVSQNIVDNVLKTNSWRELLQKETDSLVVDVDLRKEPFDSTTLNESLKWVWSEDVCKGQVILFPNTNNDSEKVLETDKYNDFADLDKKIDSALRNTKIEHGQMGKQTVGSLKMAIASGDHIYRIWGVLNEHNYYLYQMSTFNRYNTQGYGQDVPENVPALVEMDGSFRFLNIVVFCSPSPASTLECLNLKAYQESTIPLTRMMFNCENPRQHSRHQETEIITTSKKRAEYETKKIAIDITENLELPDEEFAYKSNGGYTVDIELDDNPRLVLVEEGLRSNHNNNNNNNSDYDDL